MMSSTPAETGEASGRRPWTFVPLLYFMQAIPVTVVQEVSPIIYKDFGVNNLAITKWTSLIALPWTIKLLWGPLVDLNSTKRRWMLGMQALITVCLALTAFLTAGSNAFQMTLGLLFITALFSATCDIATDGFYLLTLSKEKQAAFVGIQTTCYRLGRLFCVGALVWIAGLLQKSGVGTPSAWLIVLCGGTLIYAFGRIVVGYTTPKPDGDVVPPFVPGENYKNVLRTFTVIASSVSSYFALSSVVKLCAQGLWATLGQADPNGSLKGWMLPPVGPLKEMAQLAGCGIAAMLLFTATLKSLVGTEMGRAFGTFIRQPGIAAILAFVLFYRFGEAMVSKMAPLFLKDSLANGGMAIPNDVLGWIVGFAGVVGIVLGGVSGGLYVSKRGLRKSFWFIAMAMHTPNLLYLWASVARPSVSALYGIAFIDQFGYGFGFAGYIVYLMRVAQRSSYRTSHYAIATGLGALCIMTAGIFSGIVQSNFGYVGFFTVVIFASVPGLLTLLWIPIED